MTGWGVRFVSGVITTFARVITGVRPEWRGALPENRPRVYFANHTSHGDFVLIWAVLPNALRRLTRPVAALDYWSGSRLRRFIGCDVFRAILIARDAAQRTEDPVTQMRAALAEGASLILFPEGKRNMSDATLLPFKSGLYHLAMQSPEVEFIPVWINNLNRVMPKGEILPLPILCSVCFGPPLTVTEGEDKAGFLARAEAAVLALAPPEVAARPREAAIPQGAKT